MTTAQQPIRVWIDDHSAVFRLGVAALLGAPAFELSGESTGFSPEPRVERTDVVIFGLAEAHLRTALRLCTGTGVSLVAIARSLDDPTLLEAVEAGVAGVLIRSDVTPQALLHCIRTVASGNGFLPTAVLAHLSGRNGRRVAAAGDLTGRELDVLRLLSKGESTREIAERLSYSEKTVKNIVHDLLVRMNCRNRAQAVALATRRGLI